MHWIHASIVVVALCAGAASGQSGSGAADDSLIEISDVRAAEGSASQACVPPCRSGFVCVNGNCISACNPPCPAGYVCSNSGDCERANDEAPSASQSTTIGETGSDEELEVVEQRAAGKVNLKDYGGRVSLGPAVGGGGIVGIPLRIYFAEKLALELAAFYRPIFGIDDPGGPFLSGGLDVYFNKRYVARKRKVRLNGLFLKGGFGVSSTVNTQMIAVGWAHEMFHKKNKRYSFSFELGPGFIFSQIKRTDVVGLSTNPFALYWKLHWGFAMKPGF